MLLFKKVIDRNEIDYLLLQTDSKMIKQTLFSDKYNQWVDKINNYGIFTACYDGNVFLGCIALYANDYKEHIGYLTYIAVVEHMIDKGIGKCLLKECERIAFEEKMKFLKLEVKRENLRAINFYVKQGYYTVSESETSFYMMKKL